MKDIEKVRTECERLTRAAEAKSKMESKGSTRVVRLDGSRAMRSTTTNEMNDVLDVCVLEQTQGEGAECGQTRGNQLHARQETKHERHMVPERRRRNIKQEMLVGTTSRARTTKD